MNVVALHSLYIFLNLRFTDWISPPITILCTCIIPGTNILSRNEQEKKRQEEQAELCKEEKRRSFVKRKKVQSVIELCRTNGRKKRKHRYTRRAFREEGLLSCSSAPSNQVLL
jgi:hypothetical protein